MLGSLNETDRCIISLFFRIEQPRDWPFSWPPKAVDIGTYVGEKYWGAALTETAIRYKRRAILELLRREFIND